MAANLIKERVAALESELLEDNGDTFTALFRLRLAGGRVIPYHLWIDASRPDVVVREEKPEHLPLWCPELHVNDNGYFCLGWGKDAPDPVIDAAAADRWWGIVFSYLTLQERARKKKRWPNDNAWGHGRAATFQAYAATYAARLSAPVLAAVRGDRLKVVKSKHGFYRVLLDGHRFYAIRSEDLDLEKAKLVNSRRACLCGSGKAMRKCKDHLLIAVILALSLYALDSSQELFWKLNRQDGKTCCGRVTECPLAATGNT